MCIEATSHILQRWCSLNFLTNIVVPFILGCAFGAYMKSIEQREKPAFTLIGEDWVDDKEVERKFYNVVDIGG